MRVIVYSESDLAGKNIADHLRGAVHFQDIGTDKYNMPAWVSGETLLVETKARLVELYFDLGAMQWIICLSRHRSESGKRCLTAHTPGNLTASAELGGNPGEVGISNPSLQSRLLAQLRIQRDAMGVREEVTVEATHHGPTSLPSPVTFVEIGSDEAAWRDQHLGECVALAVKEAISSDPPSPPRAIGVGGGHYPEKFTALILEGRFAIGHIIPKYAMTGGMAPEMLSRCMERSSGGCAAVVVDWKGTPSAYKEHLRALAPSLGAELVRV